MVTISPTESDSVLTSVATERVGGGASRVGRVHGVITLKNTGRP